MNFEEKSEEEAPKQEHYLPIDQVINLPKVKDMLPDIRKQLISGDYDVLKAHIFLKKIGKLAEELVKGEEGKQIKELLEEDIRKYQEGKTSRIYGVKIIEQNRAYYKYDECNDPLWEELDKIQKKVEVLKKKREAELKLTVPDDKLDPTKDNFGIGATISIAVPYFPVLTIEENADLVFINPPYKGGKNIFAFYL